MSVRAIKGVQLRELKCGVFVNHLDYRIPNWYSSVLVQVPCETVYRHLDDLLVADNTWDGRGLSKILSQRLHELWAGTSCKYRSTDRRTVSCGRLGQVRWAKLQCHLYMCVM